MTRYTASAATMSFIDPRCDLPLTDVSIPPSGVSKVSIVNGSGCRFANLLEVSAIIDETSKTVILADVLPSSKMYCDTSFLGLESHHFTVLSDKRGLGTSAVTFTQLVGARTQSPEEGGLVVGAVVGGVAGAFIAGPWGAAGGAIIGAGLGDVVAHRSLGFPPIWSEVAITICADGTIVRQLLRHSLFPSLKFYEGDNDWFVNLPSLDSNLSNYYSQLDPTPWKQQGWGQMRNWLMARPNLSDSAGAIAFGPPSPPNYTGDVVAPPGSFSTTSCCRRWNASDKTVLISARPAGRTAGNPWNEDEGWFTIPFQ